MLPPKCQLDVIKSDIVALIMRSLLFKRTNKNVVKKDLPLHGPRYASPTLLPILQDFDFNSQRLRYDTPSVPQTIFFRSTCEVVRFCRLEHLGHFTHSGMRIWLSMHCFPLRQLINLHDAVGGERERKKLVINFHLQARAQLCGCNNYYSSWSARERVICTKI